MVEETVHDTPVRASRCPACGLFGIIEDYDNFSFVLEPLRIGRNTSYATCDRDLRRCECCGTVCILVRR